MVYKDIKPKTQKIKTFFWSVGKMWGKLQESIDNKYLILFIFGFGVFMHDWNIHKKWVGFFSPFALRWLPFRLPHHLYIGLGIMILSWLMYMRKAYIELTS